MGCFTTEQNTRIVHHIAHKIDFNMPANEYRATVDHKKMNKKNKRENKI